jgi:hypothetical protein
MPRRVWWKILGVRFELVGTIDEIETIATGPSLKPDRSCERRMVAAGGGSSRESRRSGCGTASFVELNSIGTKLTASASGI